MKLIQVFISVLLGSLFVTTGFAARPEIIGWLEHVSVHPQQLLMTAKIDTGADNSSVHAEDIEITEKNGRQMVTFTLLNKQGESRQLEKPLLRYVLIKRKGAEPLQRPVVEIDLCLSNTIRTVEVNLSNRENFKYHMLIGRSYLKQGYLVDSSRTYTTRLNCDKQSKASSN